MRSTRLTVGRTRDVKSDKLFTACRNILTLFWSPTCLRISHSTPEHSASAPHVPFPPPKKKSGSRRTSSVLPARTLLTLVNIHRLYVRRRGKGGNVTSAGWQVVLCDPIWHVSSRSSEACCELLYSALLLLVNIGCTCAGEFPEFPLASTKPTGGR